MTLSPLLIRAENFALAVTRGAEDIQFGFGELLAIAQEEMGAFNTKMYQKGFEMLDDLIDTKHFGTMIAAARIIECIAIKETDLEIKSRLLILASIAYAMYGNFPSAHALAVQVPLDELSTTEVVMLGIASPRLLRKITSIFSKQGVVPPILLSLNIFLRTGSEEAYGALVDSHEALINDDLGSYDRTLVSLSAVILQYLHLLSTSRILEGYGESFPNGFIKRLRIYCKTLLPTQYRGIDQNLLNTEGNILITLPTSTGKTLLGELCLASKLGKSAGLVVYVTPYIATGRQVYDEMRKNFPLQRVTPLLSGFRGVEEIAPSTIQEIVIATPERFDGLMRHAPECIKYLRAVVIDEAHLIEGGSRGVRLEGLITRLRLLQAQGNKFQLILLSAVLEDSKALRKWLDIKADNHLNSEWRPTARRIAVWQRNGDLNWMYGDDIARPQGKSELDTLFTRNIPWIEKVNPMSNFGAVKKYSPNLYKNVAYLCSILKVEIGSPILCVCNTKANSRLLATLIASEMDELEYITPKIEAIINWIDENAPHFKSLQAHVKRGVAFHNASLPTDLRFLIEDAIKDKELSIIAATTTLAEGVDLPFRTTILVNWLFGYGDEERPLSPLIFRNIAGRCGRAGVQTQGDTIIFDNVFGNPDLTREGARDTARNSLLQKPPALTSAIQSIFKPEIKAMVSNQYLASIAENSTDADLLNTFYKNSYYAFANDNVTGKSIYHYELDKIQKDILDNADGMAIAVANSPLKLTRFGQQVLMSGLSPDSARKVKGFLLTSKDVSENLYNLTNEFLLHFGSLPEQNNPELRKILSGQGKKFYVTLDDFEMLTSHWLDNVPLIDIFTQLPKVKKSKRMGVTEWREGKSENDDWMEDFDKFSDFMRGVFEEYIPFILRACALFSVDASNWTEQVNWSDLARRFEERQSSEIIADFP